MEERVVDLEAAVRVGDHELIPIAGTVGRPVVRSDGLLVAMVREALGVIVRDRSGLRVLLADGRELTVEQLVAEYPTVASDVSSL